MNKYFNILEYSMDLECRPSDESAEYKYLEVKVFIENGLFLLAYHDGGEEIMLTEECDISQLKNLYYQLKNLFENEMKEKGK